MYCPTCGHLNLPGADACEECGLPLANLDMPAPHDRVERSLMTESVAVLGPREPVTVGVGEDLGRAVRQMIERKVGAVLVTDAAGGLVGILTERDFLTKVAGQPGFEALPVRQFMTPRPETVAPTDTLAFALSKMDAGGYRHLPVVEGGRPVGVISVRDVLRHVTDLCRDG
ncbi:MAG TPA: CBS domain-containing protein [Gemmataceae bacterium]|nr:CBS domain-containing protein [Gemmataceae bacterium]